MAQTILKTSDGQTIGGVFSQPENAQKALDAFRQLGIPDDYLQVITEVKNTETNEVHNQNLIANGFAPNQANYYGNAVMQGKTLVIVYNVIDPAPVIDVFDKHRAEYNPDGSRNAREDVSSMTAGTVIGAAAAGAIGGAVAGPIGALGGAIAGAVIGATGGAAVGKAAEHHK